MLADYSSFLAFIGAVYFSMSLDDILTKKIWSPEDKKKLDRALDGLSMSTDVEFKKAVIDANMKKGEVLQNELGKKSVIGLFVVAFLLLYCGYEQQIYDPNMVGSTDVIHLVLAYSIVLFILTLFGFQWFLFNKWKYVSLYIIFLCLAFFSIYKYELYFNSYAIEKYTIENIGLIVCTIISIPIIWQIIITWIYKSVFYGFIKNK